MNNLRMAVQTLRFSKLSGAVGNYSGMDPKVERKALKLLGYEPYYGAKQILPREIFAPVANALAQLVLTLNKIAIDIRLGARSGRPICHEPFKKKQKGSSAMPHKKNTIRTEQIEGLARMAIGYAGMCVANISTWEERAIEQSCVERVAWPDLFHVVVRTLTVMNKVVSGLVIYPDNMLVEIVDSRGCYASEDAKGLLRKLGVEFGLTAEDCYRIVQLAAFNVFEPSEDWLQLRNSPPSSFADADESLGAALAASKPKPQNIASIISEGKLKASPDLDFTSETVENWNNVLRRIFAGQERKGEWFEIFQPSYQLRNEGKLYQEILGK